MVVAALKPREFTIPKTAWFLRSRGSLLRPASFATYLLAPECCNPNTKTLWATSRARQDVRG